MEPTNGDCQLDLMEIWVNLFMIYYPALLGLVQEGRDENGESPRNLRYQGSSLQRGRLIG